MTWASPRAFRLTSSDSGPKSIGHMYVSDVGLKIIVEKAVRRCHVFFVQLPSFRYSLHFAVSLFYGELVG
jgi:hypothetical protein